MKNIDDLNLVRKFDEEQRQLKLQAGENASNATSDLRIIKITFILFNITVSDCDRVKKIIGVHPIDKDSKETMKFFFVCIFTDGTVGKILKQIAYQHCQSKVIDFYESKLVFRTTAKKSSKKQWKLLWKLKSEFKYGNYKLLIQMFNKKFNQYKELVMTESDNLSQALHLLNWI